MNQINVPRMETVNKTAEITGVAPYRVRQLFLDGEIVGFRAGKKILINVDRFVDFLNQSTK